MANGGAPIPSPPEEPHPRKLKLQHGLKYVDDDMWVWLLWDREKGSALRCKVVVAAGNHARVVNKSFNVDKWVRIDDLYIEEGDLHGWNVPK